jgi:hypothetical protein
MLLAALAAQVAPPPERSDQSAEPTPTVAEPRRSAESGQIIERTLKVGGAGTTLIQASPGQTIRLVVEGDSLASVELKGLDIIETVAPDSPAMFDIYADREGTFPVVALESEREIARIEISR